MRLSKIEYGFYLALAARSRSEDPQTKTGCALFDENWHTVATGFNGFAPKYVPDQSIFSDRKFKSNLINHAEINAIINSSKPATYLFSVLSPCISCAKTIAATKIKEVYYIRQYLSAGKNPDMEYKSIFDSYGIKNRIISELELKNIRCSLISEYNNL